jgi:hypothetical protein
MTLETFKSLELGTVIVNTASGTRFEKTGDTEVTWYSQNGVYYQDFSVVETTEQPVLGLNLLRVEQCEK